MDRLCGVYCFRLATNCTIDLSQQDKFYCRINDCIDIGAVANAMVVKNC